MTEPKLDDTLGYIINRVARKIHYQLNDLFKGWGITVDQWIALRFIAEDGPLCQKSLAEKLEKNPNTIKSMVDQLSKRELIHREPDENDKRLMVLTLSDKGRALISEIEPKEEEINTCVTNGLTEEEERTVIRLLRKIEETV